MFYPFGLIDDLFKDSNEFFDGVLDIEMSSNTT